MKMHLTPLSSYTTNPLRNITPDDTNSDMVNLFKKKFANRIATDKLIRDLDVKLRDNNWDYKCFIEGIEFILKSDTAISNELFQINSDSISFKGYTYKNSNSFRYKSKQGFYTKMNSKLVFGMKKYGNGDIHKGEFKNIPEINEMRLVDGEITFPYGYIQIGKWTYIPENESMALVDGEVTFPDGQKQKGKRAYIPELNKMFLVDGEIIRPDGHIEKGTWDYSKEKNEMIFTSN